MGLDDRKKTRGRNPALRFIALALWLGMSVLLLGAVLMEQSSISRWLESNPMLNQPLLFFGIFFYILIGWWLFQFGATERNNGHDRHTPH